MLELPAELRTTINSVFDEMITEWGKDCLLIYPVKQVVCSCGGNFRASGNKVTKISSTCSLCNDSGFREEETTTVIKMSVIDNPANFSNKFPRNMQIPDGTIETKGFVADLPKVMQATHLIVQPSVDIGIQWKYSKFSEPKDIYNIAQNRYFYLHWTRSP